MRTTEGGENSQTKPEKLDGPLIDLRKNMQHTEWKEGDAAVRKKKKNRRDLFRTVPPPGPVVQKDLVCWIAGKEGQREKRGLRDNADKVREGGSSGVPILQTGRFYYNKRQPVRKISFKEEINAPKKAADGTPLESLLGQPLEKDNYASSDNVS